MNHKHALIAVALAAAAAMPAAAADKRSSISVFGNITIPEEGENTGTVFLSYGYLLTDSLQLEGSLGQTFSNGLTITMLDFGAKYYFGSVGKGGSTVPYVKLGLGAQTSNSTAISDTTRFLGGGGLEFTLTEAASTFVEAVYAKSKADQGGADTSEVTINLGIRLRF